MLQLASETKTARLFKALTLFSDIGFPLNDNPYCLSAASNFGSDELVEIASRQPLSQTTFSANLQKESAPVADDAENIVSANSNDAKQEVSSSAQARILIGTDKAASTNFNTRPSSPTACALETAAYHVSTNARPANIGNG